MLLFGVHAVLLVAAIALALAVGFRGRPGKSAIRPLPAPEVIWAVPLIVMLLRWAGSGMPICLDASPSSVLALASLTTGVLGIVPVLVLRRELRAMEQERRLKVESLLSLPKFCAIARSCVWQGTVCTLNGWLQLEMPLALVLVLGAFCATALLPACKGMAMAWRKVTWGSTPLDKSLCSFDLFLSYKSENVSIARQLADQLLARGIRVWFAEYYILVENREKFQEAIDTGIQRSAYGLVLTNNLWAQSPHTRHEIEEMQRAYGADAPKRILEAKVPEESWAEPHTREKHEAFEILRHALCPSVIVQPRAQAVDRILAFVSEHTRWSIGAVPPAPEFSPPQHFSGMHMGHTYHLDVGGWNVVDPGGRPCGDGDIAGPVLMRGQGTRRIGATLILGTDPAGERLTEGVQHLSDRDLYDKLIDTTVGPYLKLSAAVPRGVHLMFQGGFSQLAVTYWAVLIKAWVRMYSIILPCPEGKDGRAGEFIFTCFFHGPFSEYLQSVPVMDRLVGSFRWERSGTWSSAEAERIVQAVRGCDLDTLREMLADNPPLINARGQQGGTPLHDAAFDNWTQGVELLTSLGADVNARTQPGGLTPLHCLARKGIAETAKILLEHNADCNAQNDDGWTPLHFTSLEGNEELALLLLNSGANIDIRQTNGWAALHVAAMYGKGGVARLLVARGCDVNVRSPAGATPLHVAAGNGSKSVAEFLLSAGADINARTRAGETPMALAVKHGKLEVADWLRHCGGVE